MFLHRQELCPEKRMLFYPKLPKVIGSDPLEDRIRSIHGAQGREHASSCHVFGHTHFCWDAVVDGIRYFSFLFITIISIVVCCTMQTSTCVAQHLYDICTTMTLIQPEIHVFNIIAGMYKHP